MTRRSNLDKKWQQERKLALLALAVQPYWTQDGCPLPEKLAALIDGRLEDQEREDILEHISTCSDCYEEWLVGSTTTGETQPVERPQKVFFVKPKRVYLSFVVPLLLAASLIFFLWGPFSQGPNLKQVLANSYQTAMTGGLTISPSTRPNFILPWERPPAPYSFSPSPSPSLAQQAFAAGLWEGRRTLAKNNATWPAPKFLSPPQPSSDQPRTEDKISDPEADYYYLGQWVILVRAALLSPQVMGKSFWKQQVMTSDILEKRLAARAGQEKEAQLALAGFSKIKDGLKNIQAGRDEAKERYKTAEELGLLIERFSPA
ncbi:MAG: zf-HC2 domain-containing protein [Deltaproteobacteria bacterium]|nr:zf-HC2 domain-containing protein [Deltaproteobacteria bacterium]